MKYWLMKCEPSVYSIDHLKNDGFSVWEGVRNYQARNFMRDEMKVGDLALFYHSNATPSGVAGICRVCKEAIPDYTAWDPKSQYFDARASVEKPIWMMVEVEFVEKFPRFVPLPEIRKTAGLDDMELLKTGSRLSIQPVTHKHFEIIKKLGHKT